MYLAQLRDQESHRQISGHLTLYLRDLEPKLEYSVLCLTDPETKLRVYNIYIYIEPYIYETLSATVKQAPCEVREYSCHISNYKNQNIESLA